MVFDLMESTQGLHFYALSLPLIALLMIPPLHGFSYCLSSDLGFFSVKESTLSAIPCRREVRECLPRFQYVYWVWFVYIRFGIRVIGWFLVWFYRFWEF